MNPPYKKYRSLRNIGDGLIKKDEIVEACKFFEKLFIRNPSGGNIEVDARELEEVKTNTSSS
ncbi:hypothetical protein KKC60_05305 [Patescibacteria group bacterium]|nr:hypothetical protein [Patescibacteria group bacterium]